MVAVTAPPGYGKSTLLSQWQRQGHGKEYRAISLTAHRDDHEGDKLIIDLAEAIARLDKTSSESLLDNYGQKGRLALIRSLLAEFGSDGPRAALFIDDVHEFLGRPAEMVLRLLIRHQPKRLLLVFSGRAIPEAAVSQPLLEGRLWKFTGKDLALTVDEITEVLRQHSIVPRETLVQELTERTQGWPAVIRLIALTLEQDEKAQDSFVRRLRKAEAPQALTNYLNEVLLSQQSERLNRFLLRISLLRRFSASTAAVVTGLKGVEGLIDELEHRAFPITRSGTIEPTYQIHPLVREFLLSRLHRTRHTLNEVCERARDCLIAHDEIETAIEVCLDAENLDSAAQLINEHASRIAQQYGRHTTYLYWINKLPKSLLVKRPEIRVKQAWSLDFLRRHEEAEAIRSTLEQEYLQSNGRDVDDHDCSTAFQLELQQAIELQRCVEAGLRDQAIASTSQARRWLSRWPDGHPFDRAIAHAVLAFCVKALSDFTEGLEHARTTQALSRQCDSPYPLVWGSMLAVSNLIKQGLFRQALYECQECLSELEPRLGDHAAVMMLHTMRAGLLYEFNRLSEAGEALGRGLTAMVEQSSVDPMIIGYVTLARLQNAQGQQLAALDTLAEGEALGRSQRLPRLAISLAAERLVILLRHGELAQVEQLWGELNRFFSNNVEFERTLQDKAYRIQARIALLKGQFSEACELLAPALRHAKRTGQKKKQVELLLLQALALHDGGENRKAMSIFDDAINLSIPEGYIRVFADEGEPMRGLLETYRRTPDYSDHSPLTATFIDKLFESLSLDGGKLDPRAASGSTEQEPLIEPLTSREVQILQKMQSGLSNRELADTLFITEGTLKWHLRNIYGKLGVSNRLAAVAQANELNLLAS
ncbi:LuxR C-terminal-related transcriptional regulator [Spectribacter hydrogenooxidans]|uniref:LuxR C-terminal-related transcriptional regulator n=1 Tax=Spectribacter hydrogenoxidans TaxID=3075608 RepID=A0ABU3C0Y3_9GAMM|nr:LuxR C-terminal-related transcriptional regulator [Salinisphaera sp. W335]MDT0635198.1 LuxR C-terminal-related transcriptional regulator [Salinisphaera sp. W335]